MIGPVWKIAEYFLDTLPQNFSVPVWGFELTGCSWDRLLNLWLHRFGVMGKAECTLLPKVIKDGMTIIDVGANQGLYSLLFSKLVSGSGSVLSFEPNQQLIKSLQLNVSRNGVKNITAFPVALGSVGGSLPLYSSLLNLGDNRFGSEPHLSRRSEVEVIVFDEQFPNIRADFLKIDVQGWEFHVLQGMVQLFENSSSLMVLVEFWPNGLTKAGTVPRDLLNFFIERKYELYQVDKNAEMIEKTPDQIVRSTRPGSYVNILAIPRNVEPDEKTK